MDGSMVLHHDEKEASNDILVRRLKNRERQRRYRARKRQEADLRKASSVDQPTSLHYQHMHTEFLPVPLEDDSTRIYCQRNWKKDARLAHMHKKQETSPPTDAALTSTTLDDGHQENLLPNDSIAIQRSQPSGRHWKAEARNKKNSGSENTQIVDVSSADI